MKHKRKETTFPSVVSLLSFHSAPHQSDNLPIQEAASVV